MASRSIRAEDPEARTCSFGYVQHQLGCDHLSQRRMAAYLTSLIADHGFPRPLPAPVKGGKLTTAVHFSSKWHRAAVDAWIDGFIPPDQAATIDEQACALAAAEMDDAARNLRLVGGKDFRA